MPSFAELIASRREWIEQTLKPWCLAAPLQELRRAELEWEDIAGKVDPKATLWTWAWSRFPNIVHEGLAGVNETNAVRIALKNGDSHVGFPDNRKSEQGRLVLVLAESAGPGRSRETNPISIDEIVSVDRVDL
jgi:hypothetical protein